MNVTKVNDETEIMQNINYACDNFKNIVNNIQNSKFDHVDTWLKKTSITFEKENTNKINADTYPRFDYGTIIKVDFGVNIGSELSGPHYAITLERYDSTKNPVITILPLTSQNKKYYLPLSDLITDEFTKRLKKALNNLSKDLDNVVLSNDLYNSDFLNNKQEESKTIQKMIDYYSNYAKNSYACINQITTISKKKILRPKNKYDIIGRAKCNSKTMKIISNEIIKKYTNLV